MDFHPAPSRQEGVLRTSGSKRNCQIAHPFASRRGKCPFFDSPKTAMLLFCTEECLGDTRGLLRRGTLVTAEVFLSTGEKGSQVWSSSHVSRGKIQETLQLNRM